MASGASPGRLRAEIVERALAAYPLPIADAVAALASADSVFEMRDRVVEVFRAELRLLAAMVLSARLQLGPGPGGESTQLPELLRGLRNRGLTDGQWMSLVREGLRPWSAAADAYPVPELVAAFHARKAELPKLFDELLVMRKSETVAHGATGTRAALEEILERRVPQLEKTLEHGDRIWSRVMLVAPLARDAADPSPQAVWSLMGATPHRGRFRRVQLAEGHAVPAGEVALLDRDGKPLLSLHPVADLRRPSPDAVPELFLLDGGTKRGALYVAFPSMAEHKETHAWASIEAALTDDAPESKAEGAPEGRPYRGLASFKAEDAAFFFGREEQAEALANRIRRNGMLTLTGPSGSGKTSLLRAGVIPLLRDGTATYVRPGNQPCRALAQRLAAATGEDEAALEARLTEDPEGAASAVSADAAAKGSLHVVVLDQTEELLTLTHDAAAREAFGRALAALAAEGRATRVVISVREDFFGRLAAVTALRDLYSRHVEVVTTPDRNTLIRTLVAPAQVLGYAFEDEELVTTMVDAVAEAPAALALLSFAADRLWDGRDRKWKRLTWDAYRALGGVEGALAKHADGVLAALSAAEKAVCRSLMLRLVSGERTRAVVSRGDLLDGMSDATAGGRVLDALIAARLVAVTDAESGDPTVEIVHEALIKHWGELDRWLGEDLEGQRLAHAMRQAAREWNGRGRPRDLVWRGDMLGELDRYRKRTRDSLAGVELEFVEACVNEASRGRRVRVGLVAVALAATTGFSIFALSQWRNAEAARAQADTEKRATEHEKVNVEVRGMLAEARGSEPKGRTGHALALLRGAAALETEEGATGSTLLSLELARLSREGAGGLVLAGHTSGVYRVCVAGDSGRVVTSSLDETVRVWDMRSGAQVGAVPSQGHVVRGLACSPDGELFATGTSTAKEDAGIAAVFRVATLEPVWSKGDLPQPVVHVSFVDDGKALLVFAQDGLLRRFDVATGDPRPGVEEPGGSIMDYGVTPDGASIVTTSGDHVRMWHPGASSPAWTVDSKERVATVAISDDGSRAAWAVLDGGVVTLADARTGETVAEAKPAGTLGVAHLAFVPGGRLLVTAGPRGVDLFDAATGHARGKLRADPAHSELTISPAGDRLATRRGEAQIDLWDLATGARLGGFTGQAAEIQDLVFSPDGKALVSGSYDRTAIVFDATETDILHYWAAGRERPRRMAVAANASRIALSSDGDGLRVLDVNGKGLVPPPDLEAEGERGARRVRLSSDGKLLLLARGSQVEIASAPGTVSTGHADLGTGITEIAWSQDGERVAAGLEDGSVVILDRSLTKIATVPSDGARAPMLLELSPSADLVAIASLDRKVRVARTADGALVFGPEPAVGIPSALAFSGNGASFATSDQERVRWLETRTWSGRDLRNHEQAIVAIAFSPDGKTLASASADQSVALEFADGRPPVKLTGHTGAVVDVAFSPAGDRVLTASEDGTARVWDPALAAAFDVIDPFGGRVDGARFLDANRIALFGLSGTGAAVAVVRSPPVDRRKDLAATGARTNLRVCRSSFSVVPVTPAPDGASVWAPDDACRDGTAAR